jgi:cell division protein FtsB
MSARAVTSPTVRPAAAGRRPRVRISARASVLLVIVLIVGALSVAPLRAYLSQRQRLEQLQREADRLAAQNRELEGQIARLHDPVFLERLARQCLGMVHPGEIAFVTVSQSGEPNQPDC